MLNWKNLDTLASYQELEKTDRVNLVEVMSGENGADRVKNYSIPMVEGLTYNYAAKAVDNQVLEVLAKLAEEEPVTEVCCHFCDNKYRFTSEELKELIKRI